MTLDELEQHLGPLWWSYAGTQGLCGVTYSLRWVAYVEVESGQIEIHNYDWDMAWNEGWINSATPEEASRFWRLLKQDETAVRIMTEVLENKRLSGHFNEALYKRLDNPTDVSGMTRIAPEESGLPMFVWVSRRYGKQLPRIKVQTNHSANYVEQRNWFGFNYNEGEVAVVSVQEPKVLDGNLGGHEFTLVEQWIASYRDGLLALWNDRIDTAEFVIRVRKTPRSKTEVPPGEFDIAGMFEAFMTMFIWMTICGGDRR
jgi:hypothetical protein